MIYWVILIICFLFWTMTNSAIYFGRRLDELDKFIYALLYRGYAEEGVSQNAYFDVGIELTKYKEKGKIGIYFLTCEDDVGNKKELFLNEVRKRKLEYYVREVKNTCYVVDMGTDIELIKDMIKFVFENIFEKELKFAFGLHRVCLDPKKTVDFKDTKELEEKGIDIKIPVVKWQWILWKIKNPRGRI